MAAVATSALRSRAKACGKIILLGEHFVVPHVDGAEAPAIALPLRSVVCDVEVAFAAEPRCIADGVPSAIKAHVEAKMGEAVAAAQRALQIEGALEVRSTATIPLSRGFGSSAAFSVALTRALDALADARTARDLGAVTHAVETVFHGAPSGLDTTVILAERAVRFHRGRLVRFVPHPEVSLVAVDSGPRDGAGELIARVKTLRSREPAVWARLAGRMTELVDRCEEALARGLADRVGEIATEAHAILAELGLSEPRVEQVLADATALGSLGGKVSGAGAGGAVVLVARAGDGARLAGAMEARGHSIVAVSS